MNPVLGNRAAGLRHTLKIFFALSLRKERHEVQGQSCSELFHEGGYLNG